MQVTTKAIVLSSLKYGETSLIVKAFTASDGIKTYHLKGVLASKRGKLKAAYFQPLMQLELVAIHKNKGTLERLKEARIAVPYTTIATNISKNSMVLFLAEMLANSIREEEKNPSLFTFLETSLSWLDAHEQIANFHIYFLIQLTRYLGFYPDTRSVQEPYFDLVEGEFVSSPPSNPFLGGDDLDNFKRFLGINFDAIHKIVMTKTQRQALLQNLVLYFEVHLHGFRKPRSLAVLNEVFN